MSGLYDNDIALWAEQQADALRRRAANEIDWDNVAEEIESLGRSDKREISNRLACCLRASSQVAVSARNGEWPRGISCQGSAVEASNWQPSMKQSPATLADRSGNRGNVQAWPPRPLYAPYGGLQRLPNVLRDRRGALGHGFRLQDERQCVS